MQEAKEKRLKVQEGNVAMQLKFLGHENLREKRQREVELRKRFGVDRSSSSSPTGRTTHPNSPNPNSRFPPIS